MLVLFELDMKDFLLVKVGCLLFLLLQVPGFFMVAVLEAGRVMLGRRVKRLFGLVDGKAKGRFVTLSLRVSLLLLPGP